MRTAGRAHIQSFMWYFVHHPDPLSNRRTVITHEISRAFLAKVVYLRMNQHGTRRRAGSCLAAGTLAHITTHDTVCCFCPEALRYGLRAHCITRTLDASRVRET